MSRSSVSMVFELFDSATGAARPFASLEPGHAKIYVCGLTVQSEPHVGHVRSAVNFDVLRRWLVALGYRVTFIRNVTDVDDKIFVKAAELGQPWFQLAYDMRRELDRLLTLVNVLPPTYEPAATAHVPEVLALIDELIAGGHAYPALDGSADVYFDVRSWPAYGELTRQRLDDLHPAMDSPSSAKRDPRDFTLWKSRKTTDPATASWPSRHGSGRPGWHIGCSAMAQKYLGPSFDIHGGGIDLRFPHHENEQAQSRAAGYPFAESWMHNAWVTAAGEKMSKSLGNTMLIPQVLERVRPHELRFYLLTSHYRSTVDFSFRALEEAAVAFRRIQAFLDDVNISDDAVSAFLPDDFRAAMNNDLQTPAALAAIHASVRRGNQMLNQEDTHGAQIAAGEVTAMLDVLGLHPKRFATQETEGSSRALNTLVAGLTAERAEARRNADWARADALRDLLNSAGVSVQDKQDPKA